MSPHDVLIFVGLLALGLAVNALLVVAALVLVEWLGWWDAESLAAVVRTPIRYGDAVT
jgi:hypothetical protein